jgi:uncharacterized membrane protein YeaQ/YmgE (transglycosylase-associated protein family)
VHLDPGGLIAWPVIGAIAGWLAGQFVRGGGVGPVGDVVVGVVGALIGGVLLTVLDLGGSAGLGSRGQGAQAGAVLGAVVLIALLRALSPARAP